MKRLAILGVVLLSGCAAHHRNQQLLWVPTQCAKVTITDFTKPCVPISATSAVCDGVVIHPECVRYTK